MKTAKQQVKVDISSMLEAKKDSVTDEKWFTESIDNSIQAGADHIEIRLDAQKKTMEVLDNGAGMDVATLKRMHAPYERPPEEGISMYGIGSCIFTSHGPKRLVFTKSSKETLKAFWDVNGDGDWLLGEQAETEGKTDLLLDFLKEHGYNTGTRVTIQDVSTFDNYGSRPGKLVTKVREEISKKYQRVGGLKVRLTYINKEGKVRTEAIKFAEKPKPDRNFPTFKKFLQGYELICFVLSPKEEIYGVEKNGIRVYRSGILVEVQPWSNRKRHNDLNRVHAEISYDSGLESRDNIKLSELKDKIELPEYIIQTLVPEVKKCHAALLQHREEKKEAAATNNLTKSNRSDGLFLGKKDIIGFGDTSACFEDCPDYPYKMISGKLLINKDHKFGRSLCNTDDKELQECLMRELRAQVIQYSELTTKGAKAAFTKNINDRAKKHNSEV